MLAKAMSSRGSLMSLDKSMEADAPVIAEINQAAESPTMRFVDQEEKSEKSFVEEDIKSEMDDESVEEKSPIREELPEPEEVKKPAEKK